MAVRTYIDACVLIAAVRGEENLANAAMSYLYDPLREYVTSDYVKLELLPKCTFNKHEEERQFYDNFFSSSLIRIPSSDDLTEFAIDEGCKTGMSALDAVHIACAVVGQVEEFITAEKSTKPIHRTNGVKVISINP